MWALTLVEPNFFSVPTMAPVRWAAFRALLPLMTVSRWVAPGPRDLLPILVTVSHSDMVVVVEEEEEDDDDDDVRGVV